LLDEQVPPFFYTFFIIVQLILLINLNNKNSA